MSARQDVFGFLTSNPKASLDDVISEFSTVKSTTVRRYFFEFQKTSTKKPASKTSPKKKTQQTTTSPKKKTAPSTKSKAGKKAPKKSAKQQVEEIMAKNPDASIGDLCEAIPTAQKATLANYRLKWRREHEQSTATGDSRVKEKIFHFLNTNPQSNLNDLKHKFPEVGNKLITIFRSWKNLQENIHVPKPSIKKSVSSIQDALKEKKEDFIEEHSDTIAKQKQIIDRQKTRIEVLKKQMSKVKRPGFIDVIKDLIIDKLTRK